MLTDRQLLVLKLMRDDMDEILNILEPKSKEAKCTT